MFYLHSSLQPPPLSFLSSKSGSTVLSFFFSFFNVCFFISLWFFVWTKSFLDLLQNARIRDLGNSKLNKLRFRFCDWLSSSSSVLPPSSLSSCSAFPFTAPSFNQQLSYTSLQIIRVTTVKLLSEQQWQHNNDN